MRIGLDVTKALPPWDGVGNASRHLLRAFAELDPGHDFLLFGLPDARARRRFAAQHPDLPPRFRVVDAEEPATGEVDVYHSLTYRFPAGYRGAAVVTCYDVTVLTHPEHHTVANRLHTVGGLLRGLYAGAVFSCISRATADELGRELGMPEERIVVVPLGVDPRFRPLAAEEARRRVAARFGIASGYVLAVGTLEPRKNLRRLLEAHAALAPDARRAAPLVVAGGGGWKHEETAELLRRHPDPVRLLGHVADDDLVALYAAATVFVYPSLAEGFGLPVAEAMACGAPVVTSNVSALPEVAGDAALLVDPTDVTAIRDALAHLLTDPDTRHRLATAGPPRAARFTWRRAAEETLRLYERLVET